MKEKFKDLTIEEKEERFNGLVNHVVFFSKEIGVSINLLTPFLCINYFIIKITYLVWTVTILF